MFPFFIAAAAVLAIASGSRSGWRTQADMADAASQKKPAVQGGAPVMRWFFWVIQHGDKVVRHGPEKLSDFEAFTLEFRTSQGYPAAVFQRFIWSRDTGWVRDTRNGPELLTSTTKIVPLLPGKIGAIAVDPPIHGVWTAQGFPEQVHVNRRLFLKAQWKWPREGVVAQYREAVPVNAQHLLVLSNGTFVVNHLDESNPDQGSVLGHFLKDVLARPVPGPVHQTQVA